MGIPIRDLIGSSKDATLSQTLLQIVAVLYAIALDLVNLGSGSVCDVSYIGYHTILF